MNFYLNIDSRGGWIIHDIYQRIFLRFFIHAASWSSTDCTLFVNDESRGSDFWKAAECLDRKRSLLKVTFPSVSCMFCVVWLTRLDMADDYLRFCVLDHFHDPISKGKFYKIKGYSTFFIFIVLFLKNTAFFVLHRPLSSFLCIIFFYIDVWIVPIWQTYWDKF